MPSKYSLLTKEQKKKRIADTMRYIEKNKEAVQARRKAHYQANKERIKAETRAVSLRDPEKTSAYLKAYRKKHKAKLAAYFAAHYQANKPKLSERHRIRDAERKKTDLNYRIGRQLRCRISAAVREQYGKKAFKTMELIGCTVEELRAHIEKQWLPGMTWENWTLDGWHIDHIKAVSRFDLTDPEQQKICFGFQNLQPLWGPDNIRKGNRLTNSRTPAAAPACSAPLAAAPAP